MVYDKETNKFCLLYLLLLYGTNITFIRPKEKILKIRSMTERDFKEWLLTFEGNISRIKIWKARQVIVVKSYLRVRTDLTKLQLY